MTSLFLHRVIIIKDEKYLYDEFFHDGINVIRGDNTVGKSTILDLIFYGLGGEIKKDTWIYPSYYCDAVVLEVKFNGTLCTLKRKINTTGIESIAIKELSYEETSEWKVFGPRSSDKKLSFSQIIFDMLAWENYKTNDYANLTMHQILRMLYIDQESDSLKLFRTESTNADSESTKLAIAEFLLGLDDLDTYKTRQDLIRKEREFEKVKGELNGIIEVLGKDASYTDESLNSEIEKSYNSINNINQKKIEILKSTLTEEEQLLSDKIEGLTNQIDKNAFKISKYETLQSQITNEIVDCEEFKKNLLYRKTSLTQSKTSAKEFGFVEFVYCPSCNTKVVKEEDEEKCPLCKTGYSEKDIDESFLEILTELEFQEKQNNFSLEQFKLHLKEYQAILELNYEEIKKNKEELRTLMNYSSVREEKLSELSKEIGFIEAQIKMLEEKRDVIGRLNILRSRFNLLDSDIAFLSKKLDELSEKNYMYKEMILSKISNVAKSILETDLDYEKAFAEAKRLEDEIDFRKDRWILDGRIKFSGSSNLIKKNAFHLSCLYNALTHDTFRYPRFLIIDDIENGGMKEKRSQNFQKTILSLFGDKKEFQLIYATAMIDENLENNQYTVGRFYEKGDYVLKI